MANGSGNHRKNERESVLLWVAEKKAMRTQTMMTATMAVRKTWSQLLMNGSSANWKSLFVCEISLPASPPLLSPSQVSWVRWPEIWLADSILHVEHRQSLPRNAGTVLRSSERSSCFFSPRIRTFLRVAGRRTCWGKTDTAKAIEGRIIDVWYSYVRLSSFHNGRRLISHIISLVKPGWTK